MEWVVGGRNSVYLRESQLPVKSSSTKNIVALYQQIRGDCIESHVICVGHGLSGDAHPISWRIQYNA